MTAPRREVRRLPLGGQDGAPPGKESTYQKRAPAVEDSPLRFL